MKLLLTLFVLIISLDASSQSFIHSDGDTCNQVIEGKKEGRWIIFAKMRVGSIGKEYQPHDIYEEGYYKGSRKVGLWKRYYPSGNVKYQMNFKNGRPYGAYVKYYDKDGRKKEEGTYLRNHYVGENIGYYENGQVRWIKYFDDNGKLHGHQLYYTELGVTELDFQTNHGVECDTAYRRYPNGDLKEVVVFGKEGEIIHKEQKNRINPPLQNDWHNAKESAKLPPGALVDPPEPKKSVYSIPDGNHKLYNVNKDLWMAGEFKDNKLYNGDIYVYDDDFNLLEVERYRNGKLQK